MLPFGVSLVGVVMAAVVTFLIGMIWYSPILFAKPWVALNGYTPDKLAELKRAAPRAYGVSFVAYLVLGIGVGALVRGDPVLDGAWTGILIWAFLITPVGVTALVFSEKRLGAWLIDAGYQLVYLAAMGAILSRWG